MVITIEIIDGAAWVRATSWACTCAVQASDGDVARAALRVTAIVTRLEKYSGERVFPVVSVMPRLPAPQVSVNVRAIGAC